jgi:hypothetical protein
MFNFFRKKDKNIEIAGDPATVLTGMLGNITHKDQIISQKDKVITEQSETIKLLRKELSRKTLQLQQERKIRKINNKIKKRK